MGAHMIELARTCNQPGCHKTAQVTVRNTYNSPVGDYCRTHGARRVHELNAALTPTDSGDTP